MKASDILVKCLENEGVKYVFALPGEEIEDLLFSFSKSSIKLFTTRHEQGAAFMADVWGRLTGRAGVCLTTLGPGATNLLTGLADAHMDKSPIVAITGQADMKRLHKESHQFIDIVSMFRPIVKWNTSIHDGEIIPEVMRKAFKLAQMEKPGVTHIELPEDVAKQDVPANHLFEPKIVRRAAPDYKSINHAVSLLKDAKRPIILAGNGSIRKRASKHLRLFVENTNIPVVSTFMGKGAISDRDPHSLYSVGLQSKDFQLYAFEKADLIISVGFDIAELYPVTLQMMNKNKDKKIIHIDFTPSEVYEFYDPDVEIVADISATLWELNKRFDDEKEKHHLQFDGQWYQSIRAAIEDDHASYALNDKDVATVPAILGALRSRMKDDDIIISDVGAHKVWIGRQFPVYTPGTCIISNGFATMGIAVPGGIAAKLAHPDQQVVVVTGDGGFLMNSQEIETAKRMGINFTIILVNDNNYGMITWKQKSHRNESVATGIANPDFAMYARSFGIDAYHPKNKTEIERDITTAIHSKKLSLVTIDVNPEVNVELTQKLKKDLFL